MTKITLEDLRQHLLTSLAVQALSLAALGAYTRLLMLSLPHDGRLPNIGNSELQKMFGDLEPTSELLEQELLAFDTESPRLLYGDDALDREPLYLPFLTGNVDKQAKPKQKGKHGAKKKK